MQQIIQIISANGPVECEHVVAQVLKQIVKEAGNFGLKSDIIHREPGDVNGTLKAAAVKLDGDQVDEFLKNWVGTIQWVGKSKFDKEKTWFVGVFKLQNTGAQIELSDSDIRYEFTRSGGPGGQHVNKVSTAVRATHIATGEAVFVAQGRSQLQNKTEAKNRLIKLLEDRQFQELKKQIAEGTGNETRLEKGNPVRVLEGKNFKPNHQSKKFKSKRKSMKQELKNKMDD